MDSSHDGRRMLIVSDTLPPDPNGVALIALRTAEILAARHQVTLIGPRGAFVPPAIEYRGVARLPVGTADFQMTRPAIRRVAVAVREASGVVVHTLGPLGWAALHYAGRYRKQSTLFLHNDLPLLMRHNLPVTPATPAVEWVARRVEAWAVRRATRVIAPWNRPGATFEVLRLAPPRYETGWQAPASDGAVTVAYHGRVSREKAVDATVRAMAMADPQHERLRLRIIGDGSQLAATLALAHSLGVPAEHVPWCTDPREALLGAQIYVTASRTETYSMTTLEAIGCGMPLIARGVGRIPTYVTHNVNGLLFHADEELPSMLKLLADDPTVRDRLGRTAQETSSHRSLWEQFADASCGAVAAGAR
ncbi:MAG TPA: glycosyltransferase [Dehalococcoidia bacterium]|nr:glycosyltransferase [Dehalococcoidia bacterium]